jgi:hypothetical protein
MPVCRMGFLGALFGLDGHGKSILEKSLFRRSADHTSLEQGIREGSGREADRLRAGGFVLGV